MQNGFMANFPSIVETAKNDAHLKKARNSNHQFTYQFPQYHLQCLFHFQSNVSSGHKYQSLQK